MATNELLTRFGTDADRDVFRPLLDQMLEGCQVIDREWRYLYINDAALRHARKTRDELMGRTVMESYAGIEQTRAFRVLQECMQTRQPRRYATEFVYPDQSVGWFELRIAPIEQGLLILSLDVTVHKEAEVGLQQQLNRMRAVDLALLRDVQRAHADLTLAYDRTIEGWSRALDLRDRETEGHTERVAAATLALAEQAGIGQADRIHVCRGALLHDIGKMGVPDAILLKRSPLTEDEWRVMRQHPQTAHDLLWPIAYLRPAIDIPFCHHERWDGSGYPRGLRGEDIPLHARLFAVVDVWDALRTDRPYRRRWAEEAVLEYLTSQAGIQFDPHAVELFIGIAEHWPRIPE